MLGRRRCSVADELGEARPTRHNVLHAIVTAGRCADLVQCCEDHANHREETLARQLAERRILARKLVQIAEETCRAVFKVCTVRRRS